MSRPFFKFFSIWLYVALSGLLYGTIFAGQVLGILGAYSAPAVLTLGLLVAGLCSWALLRPAPMQFYTAILPPVQQRSAWLEFAGYAVGFILLVLYILLPLARWPYSPISETLNWDAGLYHFPKAIELFSRGTAWDLTLSYGEYPFGYESLLAFTLALCHNTLLFGSVHALLALYMFLTLWFLARRFTRLPPGLLSFVVCTLLLSGAIPIDSNLWWIFKHLLYTIGKNDLFLGTSLLAIVLHAPVGTRQNRSAWLPLGMAIHTMIALSIKPNAIFIAALVWALSFVTWYKGWRVAQPRLPMPWLTMLALFGIVLPGALWVLRNLLAQGAVFSPDTLQLQLSSIASNLTNPYLYSNLPQHLILLVAIALLVVFLSFVVRHPDLSLSTIFIILLVGFILTPASALLNDTQTAAQIAWRFAVAPLAWAFLIMLNLLDPLIFKIYCWLEQHFLPAIALLAVMLAFSAWLGWDQRHLLTASPKNAIVLHDQFRQPVGVGGYHSAYDYVQKNIRSAVIHVDNGLPFYVYDPKFTNSVTHQLPADYYLVFKTAWFDDAPEVFPALVSDITWQKDWQLIYEDKQGRVYERKE